jgi:benzoyl-CoA reductase subunit B
MVTIDIPGTRSPESKSLPGSEDFAYEQRYLLGQIKELIAVCEKVSGQKFDIDKFREVLGHANQLSLSWQRVIELNQNRPAVYNAMTDGTVFLGVANAFRGLPEGAEYFAELVDEMEYRVAHGIGILGRSEAGEVPVEQKFRLSMVGTPCYPIFRRFDDMFVKWGGVFVNSSYLWFGSGGTCAGYLYDLDNPLESFATGQLLMAREAMDSMFHQSLMIEQTAGGYAIDGVVFHPIKSCRTVSTGMADQRRHVVEMLGLPTLILESDFMDPQVISEAQMRNRVDAFFEGLNTRQLG